MVQSAELGKEVVLTVVNKIGVLNDMSKLLAEHGLNIEAVAGYTTTANEAKIMLVTNDNLRAVDAFKKAGYKGAKENPVIILVLQNKPGALKVITSKLASEDIDIKYIYGTTCPGDLPAKIIISTSNDEKALVGFKK